MPNLRDIKKRIDSVKSTRQITRTMEMVATAKIRRSTQRVLAATPYSNSMMEMLGGVAGHASTVEHPLLEKREEQKRALLIAVVSDRGLAGGFNSNVMRAVDHYIARKAKQDIPVDLIACGKKAVAYFKYRKMDMVKSYVDLSADPTIEEAREIAHYAITQYSNAEVDEVEIIFNHARNAADQDLVEELVLPIEAKVLATASSESGPEAQYEFEPSPEEVLTHLLPAYVETRVYHALIDSAAAEQGARRKAMKSATDNANEMVDTLTRSYNRARQAAITTEINEIVGGAAALEDA
jgi:F-type H+-transporting ATPase subunit gamma